MSFLKKPPCAGCPYKLGIIKTLVNPCPTCRINGYRAFKQFTESKQDKHVHSKSKK